MMHPMASPSSPSVRFTEFVEPISTTITQTTNGTKATNAMPGTVLGQKCHSKSGRHSFTNGTVNRVEKNLNCSSTTSTMATAAPASACQKSLARAVNPRLRRCTTLM